MSKYLILPLVVIFSAQLKAEETCTTYSCKVKKKQQDFVTNIQQVVKGSYEEIVSTPMKASEAGCLDSLQALNISMFTVDPLSLWDAAYNQMIDQVVNKACEAVNAKIEEKTKFLDQKLEAPYGLGAIEVEQGRPIASDKPLLDSDFEFNNQDAIKEVRREMFGTTQTPKVRRDWSPQKEKLESSTWVPDALKGDKNTKAKAVEDKLDGLGVKVTDDVQTMGDAMREKGKEIRERFENKILTVESLWGNTSEGGENEDTQ